MKFSIIKNLSIKYKLISFSILVLFSILSLIFLNLFTINKIESKEIEIYQNYNYNLLSLKNFIEYLYILEIEIKNNILISDKNIKKNNIEISKKKRFKIIGDLLNKYGNLIDIKEEEILFKKLKIKLEKYKKVNLNYLKNKEDIIFFKKELKYFEELKEVINELNFFNLKKEENLNKRYENIKSISYLFSYIFSSILIIILFFSSFILIKNISKLLKNVNEHLNKVEKGQISDILIKYENTEIANMERSINNFLKKYKDFVLFINELTKNNLDSQLSIEKKDVLGIALFKLQKSMIERKLIIEENNKKEEKRIWENASLNQLSTILRNNSNNLKKLSNESLSFLVKQINANQGGIFLVDNNKKYLDQVSCFAYDRKRKINKKIDIEEGLIGRCIEEKKVIYLKEIPENYLKITSGLGKSNPKNLILIPLKLDKNNVIGALEIASFYKIEKYHIEFLEKSCENIALTISSVRVNERTSELYKQSKRQEDEMASQEEELMQNLEELKATQEAAAVRENELNKKLDEAKGIIKKLKNN